MLRSHHERAAALKAYRLLAINAHYTHNHEPKRSSIKRKPWYEKQTTARVNSYCKISAHVRLGPLNYHYFFHSSLVWLQLLKAGDAAQTPKPASSSTSCGAIICLLFAVKKHRLSPGRSRESWHLFKGDVVCIKLLQYLQMLFCRRAPPPGSFVVGHPGILVGRRN
ncbi:hypothetical protein NDU88_004713 [Pleurodeles waltl]|uniref:Uncharacterized protein n=1 Tax=Pleurodeles waltl TaxID=8319 RepID=A0AAV7KZ64_PLEWA|nr:hypothetical protein NDU88_004713 [Pleurodeles waltl]